MENKYYITSDGVLMHYGVKGMKWGVRRYQNEDGSLTEAGKKRWKRQNDRFIRALDKRDARYDKQLSQITTNRKLYNEDGTLTSRGMKKLSGMMTDRRTDTIHARKLATEAIRSDSKLTDWKNSESYKSTLHARAEQQKAKEKYWDLHDKVWRSTLKDMEKKYGQYEDLERNGDIAGMAKFDKEYGPLLKKNFKEQGVYKLEKIQDEKYEALQTARKTFYKDTRAYVDNYLGKYGEKQLKGLGSIYRPARDVVERLTTSDIMVQAYTTIDDIGMPYGDLRPGIGRN